MTEFPLSTEPLALLMKAYEEVAQREQVEWVLLSRIGTVLKQFNGAFSPVGYGHKDLLTFVKAYPERFETRRQASKGKPVQVRRRDTPALDQAALSPSSVRATTTPVPSARKKVTSLSSPVPKGTATPGKTQPLCDVALTALLVKAYSQAAENLLEQWVSIPQLAAVLKRLDPDFRARVYGYKDLPTLVQSCNDLFLTRKQKMGKTKHVEVRLVTGK
jgi:hypothetical protein